MPGDLIEVRMLEHQAPGRAPMRKFAGRSVRQQRRRLLGLPLQRPAHRAAPARGRSPSSRSIRIGRPAVRARGLQLSLDTADRSRRESFINADRLSRHPRRSVTTVEKNFATSSSDIEIPIRPHLGVIGLAPAHVGAGRLGSAHAAFGRQSRQLADRPRLTASSCRWPYPAACSRWAIRMRRKATRNCAAPPSNAR